MKFCAREFPVKALRVSSQFQAGRQAFLQREYASAMEHFGKVAQARPDYAFVAANFRQGIWTYLGRTEYRLNRLSEAHRSFERALVMDNQDSLAELYFGLTLARENDTARAVAHLEKALKDLSGWIDSANASNPSAALWDSQGEIRSAIAKSLQAVATHTCSVQELITIGEWIGERMEAEVQQVGRDESRRLNDEY